ncbi:MAG: ankyrin-like protein, partial [uncultured Blastococcus sp.]
ERRADRPGGRRTGRAGVRPRPGGAHRRPGRLPGRRGAGEPHQQQGRHPAHPRGIPRAPRHGGAAAGARGRLRPGQRPRPDRARRRCVPAVGGDSGPPARRRRGPRRRRAQRPRDRGLLPAAGDDGAARGARL